MDIEDKIEAIVKRYNNRVNMLMSELKDEMLQLAGIQIWDMEQVTVRDLRVAAMLSEALDKGNELKRQIINEIAIRYGCKPGTLGVLYRQDVNLLQSNGVHRRSVTDKGKLLVNEYREKFGKGWIKDVYDIISDQNVYDSHKIKLRIRKDDKNE